MDETVLKTAKEIIELEKENRELLKMLNPELAKEFRPLNENIDSVIYIALKNYKDGLLERIEKKESILEQKNNSRRQT